MELVKKSKKVAEASSDSEMPEAGKKAEPETAPKKMMSPAHHGATTLSQTGGLTALCLASMGQGGKGHLELWQKCQWETNRNWKWRNI